MLFSVLALGFVTDVATADVLWFFETRDDSGNDVEGSLMTSGTMLQANTPGAQLPVISLLEVSYNGTLLTNWNAGGSLPFGVSAPGDNIRVTTPGNGEVDPATGNSVQFADLVTFSNFVSLARPGTGASSLVTQPGGDIVFVPTSTIFSTNATVSTETGSWGRVKALYR